MANATGSSSTRAGAPLQKRVASAEMPRMRSASRSASAPSGLPASAADSASDQGRRLPERPRRPTLREFPRQRTRRDNFMVQLLWAAMLYLIVRFQKHVFPRSRDAATGPEG